MKKYLSLLLALAVLLSLTACADAPATTETAGEATETTLELSPEQEALALCGGALAQLQEGSYHIATRREFVDDGSYTEFEHWKNGEDWMNLSKHKQMNIFFAALYCGGQSFENTANTEMEWVDNIQWNTSSGSAMKIPLWLDNCRWEDQEVQLLDSAENGKVVTVQFLTPYKIGDQTAEGYTVDFHFDSQRELQKAVMTAVFKNENGRETRWVDEMTIISTYGAEISAKLQGEYQRALEQNQ